MPHLGPFGTLGVIVAALFLCLIGLFLVCFGAGEWGKRKATREGRICPHCELWADDPVDIELHQLLEHQEG